MEEEKGGSGAHLGVGREEGGGEEGMEPQLRVGREQDLGVGRAHRLELRRHLPHR
eukprot:SAG11_NODE_26638_length_342_cov_2.213992_1_plen_55_part_00